MIGRVVLSAALSVAAVAADAQVRTLPATNDPRPFVEQSEPGAPGDIQVIALSGRREILNPYTGKRTEEPKATADLVFYDRVSGYAFVVRTLRGPYGPPWPFEWLFECAESHAWRPGLTWTVADLDGDGRDDVIAHDPQTGDVVRLFQRGEPCR